MAVRVEPSGITIDPQPGESIMAAAQRAGHSWPTLCGGDGECTVCHLFVEAGAEHLSPMAANERKALAALIERFGPAVRLACQTTVDGPAIVRKRGVRALP